MNNEEKDSIRQAKKREEVANNNLDFIKNTSSYMRPEIVEPALQGAIRDVKEAQLNTQKVIEENALRHSTPEPEPFELDESEWPEE